MITRTSSLIGATFLTIFLTGVLGVNDLEAQRTACTLIGYGPPPVAELTGGPRTAAMAGVTIGARGSSSQLLYSNPAALDAAPGSPQAAAGHLDWIGNAVVMTSSAALAPESIPSTTLGVGLVHARYGTSYPEPEPCQGSQTSSTGFVFGGSFRASNALSAGIALQSLYQQGSVIGSGYGLDVNAGLDYSTGFRSLSIHVNGRNLLGGVNKALGLDSFYRGGESPVAMPSAIGVAAGMDVLDLLDGVGANRHEVWLAAEVGAQEELGRVVRLAGEYRWDERVMLRLGYLINDGEMFTTRAPAATSVSSIGLQHAGLGVRHAFDAFRAQMDYAFAYRQRYDNDHRLAVSFIF